MTSQNFLKDTKLISNMVNVKAEIFKFISTHESQVSHDIKDRDDSIDVRFTTFGNRAGCKAVYEIIEMLNEDVKLEVIEMMKSKRVTI
jgi:hypothetical protein